MASNAEHVEVLTRAADTLHDLGAPLNAEEVRKVIAALAPAAAPEAGEWVLTMRGGVSAMNDNVIGTFHDYATALSVGGMLYEADKIARWEYRTFDVTAAPAPQEGGRECFDAWHDAKYPEPDLYHHKVEWRASKRAKREVWDAALAAHQQRGKK